MPAVPELSHLIGSPKVIPLLPVNHACSSWSSDLVFRFYPRELQPQRIIPGILLLAHNCYRPTATHTPWTVIAAHNSGSLNWVTPCPSRNCTRASPPHHVTARRFRRLIMHLNTTSPAWQRNCGLPYNSRPPWFPGFIQHTTQWYFKVESYIP